MAMSDMLPEIVLFGASMTEWSFREETQGLGWVLEKKYAGKTMVVNGGIMHSSAGACSEIKISFRSHADWQQAKQGTQLNLRSWPIY
jgi:hypothetical protein